MKSIVMGMGLLVLLAGLPLRADDKPVGESAKELLGKALNTARAEKKMVFLVFGAPGCGWCVRLEQYHAVKEVAAILQKHFVIVKVDTSKNPGGKELYERFGKDRGVPAFTILDGEDKMLADSADGGDNIGFPYEPEEIEMYFKILRKVCPTLTEKDVAILTTHLKAVAKKKE